MHVVLVKRPCHPFQKALRSTGTMFTDRFTRINALPLHRWHQSIGIGLVLVGFLLVFGRVATNISEYGLQIVLVGSTNTHNNKKRYKSVC